MNIIEKAVEKLEEEVEDLLREENQKPVAPVARPKAVSPVREEASTANPPQAESAPPGVAAPVAPCVPIEPPVAVPTPAVSGASSGTPGAGHSETVELDLDGLSAAGYVTPNRDQSLLAEEFRIVKRPLLERATPGDPAFISNGNLIIITSSLPGEGKTFNSINLAFSMAMEVDRRVLLVDADVAKSDVSRVLGLGSRPGLSNYLEGSETDLSKLMVRTNVDSLTLLPSGPRHGRITELLASPQMRSLVSELSVRYPDRLVVFDSPPLLATTGASVLAGLMGQVLMVVEAVRTPKSAVRESVRRLGAHPNVSIVFNKQRKMAGGRYGYGYYGYGYGYGYGDDGNNQAESA